MLAGLSFKTLLLTMLFMAKAMATLFEYHIQDVFQTTYSRWTIESWDDIASPREAIK